MHPLYKIQLLQLNRLKNLAAKGIDGILMLSACQEPTKNPEALNFEFVVPGELLIQNATHV